MSTCTYVVFVLFARKLSHSALYVRCMCKYGLMKLTIRTDTSILTYKWNVVKLTSFLALNFDFRGKWNAPHQPSITATVLSCRTSHCPLYLIASSYGMGGDGDGVQVHHTPNAVAGFQWEKAARDANLHQKVWNTGRTWSGTPVIHYKCRFSTVLGGCYSLM